MASTQVWAYANLGYDPGALLDTVAQCSQDRMREFSPQNISNILWAYAKLGRHSGSLMLAKLQYSYLRSCETNCILLMSSMTAVPD